MSSIICDSYETVHGMLLVLLLMLWQYMCSLIKLMCFYMSDSYNTARSKLRQAEETSALETDMDEINDRHFRRK